MTLIESGDRLQNIKTLTAVLRKKTVTILIRMILSLVRILGFTPNLMEILFNMRMAIKMPMCYMSCAANRSFQ